MPTERSPRTKTTARRRRRSSSFVRTYVHTGTVYTYGTVCHTYVFCMSEKNFCSHNARQPKRATPGMDPGRSSITFLELSVSSSLSTNTVVVSDKPSAGMESISSTAPPLSPREAGKRAAALALVQKNRTKKDSLSTLAAHAGIENIHNAPLAPPLHVATTYTRPADGIYHTSDSIYAREDNPTRLLLEKTVFGLETWGLDLEEQDVPPTSWAFSSGMMAATAIVLAHSSPLTVILAKDVYHGVPTLLVEVFSRHRVDVRRVDMTGPPDAIVEEIRRVPAGSEVIVWMESPSNPLCEVVDIAAMTTAVKGIESHVITTVVDVTMASPIVTRPLEVSINDHTIS
jgi:Cys/Met metabolism PLP-dependent enzyme